MWLVKWLQKPIRWFSAKRKAKVVINQIQHDWGQRGVYPMTLSEMQILITAGAEVVKLNEQASDGTFTHELKYRGIRLVDSTANPIAPKTNESQSRS